MATWGQIGLAVVIAMIASASLTYAYVINYDQRIATTTELVPQLAPPTTITSTVTTIMATSTIITTTITSTSTTVQTTTSGSSIYQSAFSDQLFGQTSWQITLGSTSRTGNLLVVMAGEGIVNSTSSISDTYGLTWTKQATAISTGNFVQADAWTAVVPSTENSADRVTVLFTNDTNSCNHCNDARGFLVVYELSGVNTTSGINTYTGTDLTYGQSTTPACLNSFSIGSSGIVLVGWKTNAEYPAFNAGQGYIIDLQGFADNGADSEYMTVGVGSTQACWNVVASQYGGYAGNWATVAMTFDS
jgi:hypothetical protein